MEFTEQFSWPKSLENTLSANKAASYLIAKSRFSSAFPFTIYEHLLCYPLLNLVALSGASNPLTKFLYEIQNNVMRSFLGAGRNAPIATLLRDIISCSPLHLLHNFLYPHPLCSFLSVALSIFTHRNSKLELYLNCAQTSTCTHMI